MFTSEPTSLRGRTPAARLTTSLLLITGAGGLLSGCASSVAVTVPSGASVAACRAPAWPARVADKDTVTTEPAAPSVHAWGRPPVIARCGFGALAATADQCISVDGVDWVARRLSDGAAFTTFGTDPAIEVLVPSAYAPEPLVLPAFSAVAKALPRTTLTCR